LSGEVINGVQGCYRLGAAGYDAVTGDRDGAISHGVQGAFGIVGMLPGAKDVLGAGDKALG
jgi:hypothetical protein